MLDAPAVDVRGVYRTFAAELAPVRALRGVDLHVDPGEFVAVMRPSGCGTSTLLNVIAGLERPDEGEVFVAGRPLNDHSPDQLARLRREHIGVVFQFFHLVDGISVIENAMMPTLLAGWKRRRAEGRARDLLDLLGLADKAGAAPATLSGGQRQRLAIARAMANTPTVLLADEPTGALDSQGSTEIVELFARLHRDTSQTIVLITHDPEVAAAAARIEQMHDGQIVAADG